ncbi:ribulokinase [Spirochaetia bacterium]|nr:ribulokinase [Spirochaetia bacterium]
MALEKGTSFVLGLDYGSDSCRAVVIDAADGSEVGVAVMQYPRWTKGLYCDSAKNQFRQHPQDYIDVLEGTVKEAIARAGSGIAEKVKGLAIDTTGSTPCAVDDHWVPLALKSEFAENPSAMFVLWKDHTAVAEAEQINTLAKTWGGIDYTKYEGGIYSSEWFWAKIMHVFKEDANVAAGAYSFLEHCDWMTALLTGTADVKRSRCAMGHKAMWHGDFAGEIPGGTVTDKFSGIKGGYPSADFLSRLDPRLLPIRESLGTETYTSDQSAGGLSPEWAKRLGLPAGIPVAVGAYDAHMGAVGGGVKTGWLVRVMGTSTCDVIVGPKPQGGETLVRGICGQVDGSVIPGMVGYEAGQSAFGDVYAWFKKLLLWPIEAILPNLNSVDAATKETIAAEISKKIIPLLEDTAQRIDPASTGIIALDWLNGRRTPDADQLLKGAIVGLTLGSDAPRVYRALAEATAFGARAIVERFREQGVAIEGIIGIGGVARKSPFVMQILADVLNMPIDIPACDQAVALGAAMFAAVAAGLYADIPAAQKAIGPAIEKTYTPNPERVRVYEALYKNYRTLGQFTENYIRGTRV